MAGGASRFTEDYIRSLPTAPSVDSLGSTFKPDLGKVVRVDRKIYEWFGGDGGSWEEVFTIPSDYSPEGAPAEETAEELPQPALLLWFRRLLPLFPLLLFPLALFQAIPSTPCWFRSMMNPVW